MACELFDCVKSLGLRTGIRYYRLAQRVKVEPGIVEDWASSCQAAAMDERDPAMQAALKQWAFLLRSTLREHEARICQKN